MLHHRYYSDKGRPSREKWVRHVADYFMGIYSPEPPWLPGLFVWVAAYGSDQSWTQQAERLIRAAEVHNPWVTGARWDSEDRLTRVKKAILARLLPLDSDGYVARALSMIDGSASKEEWATFVAKAQAAGPVGVAASVSHPPLLWDRYPTVEEYRKTHNGYADASVVAEWATAALNRSGTGSADDIIDAILSVFEGGTADGGLTA